MSKGNSGLFKGTLGTSHINRIYSEETRVEFARLSIQNVTYLVRGVDHGTEIPSVLLSKMIKFSGTLDFHSHPFNDDCVPSLSDRNLLRFLRQTTKQKTSSIVTPNGRTVLFDENGVIETGTVSNHISDEYKALLLELFGGQENDN